MSDCGLDGAAAPSPSASANARRSPAGRAAARRLQRKVRRLLVEGHLPHLASRPYVVWPDRVSQSKYRIVARSKSTNTRSEPLCSARYTPAATCLSLNTTSSLPPFADFHVRCSSKSLFAPVSLLINTPSRMSVTPPLPYHGTAEAQRLRQRHSTRPPERCRGRTPLSDTWLSCSVPTSASNVEALVRRASCRTKAVELSRVVS